MFGLGSLGASTPDITSPRVHTLKGIPRDLIRRLPSKRPYPRQRRAIDPRPAYGDVGGFGVGAHSDWQVLGTIDYTLNPSWNLHLGYRSLNFDITGSEGRFGFNVHMRGPIFAGTFRF